MNSFECVSCGSPIRIAAWDLVPSSFPEKHFCGGCGAANMLSRKTLLLCVLPCILLMLVAGLVCRAVGNYEAVLPAVFGGYALGAPVGVVLARRYGRLGPPLRPLL
ncbi:hypothetical protein GCM10027188_29060 [Lysobacter humi (ex Lee et al. 2017)]